MPTTGTLISRNVRFALRSTALAAVILTIAACGVGRRDPTEPTCTLISGAYNATFSNSCGGSGSGPVVVTQVGCTFNALIPGFGGGSVAGVIDGNNATFTLYFASPCSGSATGTATIGNTRVSGTFSGGATGSGCCNPVSGSFLLMR